MNKGKKKIVVWHCGFHGWNKMVFYGHPVQRQDRLWAVKLTPQQIKRLNRIVCGWDDCLCGECVADYDGYLVYKADNDSGTVGTQHGRYH